MKRLIPISIMLALPFFSAFAEDSSNTLASTLEVYVFPTDGQDSGQQSKDEAECYSWALVQRGQLRVQLQER